MKKILKYRDVFYILILFVWFLYPRQNSVRQVTKPNREEIKKLEAKIIELKYDLHLDSLSKLSMLKNIDSLQKARTPIYNIIQQKDEQIKEILRSANLPDSTLYRFFSNVKTNNY